MTHWRVHYDMRAPDIGAPADQLYRVALEQAAWLDARGCTSIMLSEHHGAADRTCPSPLALAAAVGAVSTRVRILVAALLLPLHDPIRAAEDAIVADLVSGGRLDIVIGLGYVRREFDFFGLHPERRVRDLEAKLAVFLPALTGQPFERDGQALQVTPAPAQRPRPPVLLGGSVPASARRAARFADGYFPAVVSDELIAVYEQECTRLGRTPGPVLYSVPPLFVHVSEDPERTWSLLGPHVLDEVNTYMRWTAENDAINAYEAATEPITDIAVVRGFGQYAVLTPDECVALARRLPSPAPLTLKPLLGGFDPDLAWESLELFAARVLPRIDVDPPHPAAPVAA